MQFVYHQLLRICYFKVIDLPVITVFLYLEGRNDSYSSLRISHTFVIGRSRNIFIIIRIKNLFRIGISQANHFTRLRTYIILESILFASIQPRQRNPPTSGSIITIHLRFFVIAQCPVIEVAHYMGKVLMIPIRIFVIKYQCHRRIIHYIDTLDHTGRHCCSFNFTRNKTFIFCVGHLNKGIRFYPFLIAVCTANHYSEPVHRCLPASKPFPDIRAQRNAPYVGFG